MTQVDKLIEQKLREGMGSNPTVNKAYGVKSFKELYNKIKNELPDSLLKKVDGWVLEDREQPKMPIALVVLKDGMLINLGMQGPSLVMMRSRAIFKMKKMAE